MLKKLCFYWRSFWRWSKCVVLLVWSQGLVGQRSDTQTLGDFAVYRRYRYYPVRYRDHKKARHFFRNPLFFYWRNRILEFFSTILLILTRIPLPHRYSSLNFSTRLGPQFQSSLMGISGPIPPMSPFFQEIAGLYFFGILKGSWWLISLAPRRLVQVGFHRADCLHQLILANLKLGHYSKAKAIGLEWIWWLGVGVFWGLTLFFLGV